MNTYNIFLDYYDRIVRQINSPLEDEVDFLEKDCIKKYHPKVKTILETACWTWVVALELQKKWFLVTWLDINEKMLERAWKIINEKNLVLWNMTNFDLKKKFDVVLCNYNSICHLLKWKEWQSFFDMSYNHLHNDWLLIFDINTLYEFESITRDFAQFYNFGDDSVCMEMFKKNDYFQWLIKIFKKEENKKYDLIEEVVNENSFEIVRIKNELKLKWFEILEIVDFHYWEVSEISERVYFICKKI